MSKLKVVRDPKQIERDWETNPRWDGVTRSYTADDVLKLRGSIDIEYTLAELGAERLWRLLAEEPYVSALGALTGNQAIQQVRAGLQAIYLSGWQVAADANLAGQMYPDQSLYPSNSVPQVVKRINQALQRADQIDACEGKSDTYWFAPIVADAEAGFGGNLYAFELMKLMLAADVCGVPSIVVARTDAHSATLITSDVDERDHPFIKSSERTPEGFFAINAGIDMAIARAIAYAPHADILWCETSTPDLEEAKQFAEGVHAKHPGKLLAYNCSPSFNWAKKLDAATIAKFQRELGAMGYKFQFVTLAGFHALNYSMFELARQYREEGMTAYSRLQQNEFAAEEHGYTATRHQREVGTGYFDEVAKIISAGSASTLALEGSTEAAQF
jgi:isocitrate lyase